MTFRAVDCVLWDFDGVIIDTETAEFAAWQSALATRAIPLDLATYLPMMGTRQTSQQVISYALSRDEAPEPQPRTAEAEILDSFQTRFRALVSELPLRRGVRDLLHATREDGISNWIVSSSDRSVIARALERLGATQLFSGIVSGDTPVERKPSPAPYLRALEESRTCARRARAIEDSLPGTLSALGAGIAVVAATNPVTADVRFPDGVPVVSGIDEISVDYLQAVTLP